LSLQFVNIF